MTANVKEFILALDIGTSSVRAALYDDKGNVLPQTMVKNERTLTATDDGGAEIDADEAFDQVIAVIDDVLAKAEKVKGAITHVAASCFWHSLVGIDAKGKATTKVLGWADTRSREAVAVLRKKFDEQEVHNRTGARFHSSYWPAKLLWLKGGNTTGRQRALWPKGRNTTGSERASWLKGGNTTGRECALWPEGRNTTGRECVPFEQTGRWLSLSDYILLRLTDNLATSVSMASATGIFDIRKCEWDRDLIKFLKLKPANFPPISDDKATYRLNTKFAKRWPRLAHAQWFPAIGDGAANNIGADCVTKSKAALMIGTSGAMRVAYKGEPPKNIPSGLWCYRIDRNRVVIGGALSDGGGLYQWLKDNLRLLADDDKTEAKIAKRPPAGHGLIFLPFLAGERSTGYHENATGAILGLRSATDTIDIVQAALESVAYRFAEIFDQLNSVIKIREIIASGGALRQSPVWTQIIADVLGRDLSLPDIREASSRGAVLLALETIGKIENIEQISTTKGQEFMSEKRNARIYRSARRRHRQLYEQVLNRGESEK